MNVFRTPKVKSILKNKAKDSPKSSPAKNVALTPSKKDQSSVTKSPKLTPSRIQPARQSDISEAEAWRSTFGDPL